MDTPVFISAGESEAWSHYLGSATALSTAEEERALDASQLKRIPLFADASEDELKRVALFAESKEVPEGEVVLEEGGFSRELLAIEEGTADVTRDGEHVADLGPGDIFGEAGMLDDEMRSATVTATSPLKLISLRHFEVQRLKKDAPEVFAAIENLVEQRKSS
jgi:CRP/FNR family transcriptional regulator, cyclic AMP receptor protein